MTARELVCMNLVVAAVAATIWFVQDLGDTTKAPIFSPTITPDVNEDQFESVIQKITIDSKHKTEDTFMANYDHTILDGDQYTEVPNIEERNLNLGQFESRGQVMENLYEQFSALESQYGILSIDDIALLQESLADIDEDEMLADLSDAMDELLVQP